ncbi:phosphopantetheine adenylyltransferase [Anaerocolumna cellulosilytica]|uniref:Phosphopantetheine adenylyltransferase n=1 Tax=Anaerocolumna cellulosilytica TaxID=433286 RepID=A0A6S6R097_9FIRM|nr:pantetheine-phosphate adenylyltransferase [Anaerocolumna cellulosilytica]MBB5197446.1 pantetheine-phosphate adenylyltransferase [Anaerocolumna cellulosilytica]BCJ95466.1 phosphopantetheine adenylyltransferase [Anaerocolumna cellulosilytica]
MRIGIYPGSFDPVTLGHLDIIYRASKLVDRLIIGVLTNSKKSPLFTTQERVLLLEEATKGIPNVVIEAYQGLLVDFAEERQAGMIVRGLRAITDFEYELQLAQTNHKINPKVDTVFLTTSVEYAYLSSSMVREIASYGGKIDQFVPACVAQSMYEKYNLRRG